MMSLHNMLPFQLTKDTHTSPFRASYGMSFMSTSTEIDRVIKGFYCSKLHGANMGPIWGLPNPGGPHVGPMNFAIWAHIDIPC